MLINLKRQEKKRIKRELNINGKELRRMQKKARKAMQMKVENAHSMPMHVSESKSDYVDHIKQVTGAI